MAEPLTPSGLPSHLAVFQAAHLLGISRQAVADRIARGTLPTVDLLGGRMVPTAAILDRAPLLTAPVAFTPAHTLKLLNAALEAIRAGQGDDWLFTAREVAGLYLSLNPFPGSHHGK